MSLKEFDKTFGLESSIDEEKSKFVNRIENSIFNIFPKITDHNVNAQIFKGTCYQLGEDANAFIKESSSIKYTIPNLSVLSKKDFIQTLRVVIALYKILTDKPNFQRIIDSQVIEAIELTTLNIGIKWKDGVFYPTGDKFLDTELIDYSLTLLDKFPNEKTDLKNALENYYSKSLYGVVENCYIAIEGIGRQLLNNKKTLDNNREDLLKLLQFSKYWDKIFLNFLSYAHEFRRHAGENRHELKSEEVEGFLYLTCLIIRATIRASSAMRDEAPAGNS